MKFKLILFAPILAAMAFATPAIAEDDGQNPPATTGQNGIQNPEGPGQKERGGFEHRINESGENGFEAVQFLLIGGALVVAVLLAYNAGKRNRKKKD